MGERETNRFGGSDGDGSAEASQATPTSKTTEGEAPTQTYTPEGASSKATSRRATSDATREQEWEGR